MWMALEILRRSSWSRAQLIAWMRPCYSYCNLMPGSPASGFCFECLRKRFEDWRCTWVQDRDVQVLYITENDAKFHILVMHMSVLHGLVCKVTFRCSAVQLISSGLRIYIHVSGVEAVHMRSSLYGKRFAFKLCPLFRVRPQLHSGFFGIDPRRDYCSALSNLDI